MDNTTSITDMVARVSSELAAAGISVGDTGNAAARRGSQVQYAPGERGTARYVAAQLDGLPIERNTTLEAGGIRVLLATDYDGPGRTTLPAGGGGQPQAPSSTTTDSDPITADGIPCIN